MITETSQDDVAVLVINSSQGGFDAGISKNGQTHEHVLLAYTLGVKQMIVSCNKIDDKTVKYDEGRYKEIKSKISSYMKKVRYKQMRIIKLLLIFYTFYIFSLSININFCYIIPHILPNYYFFSHYFCNFAQLLITVPLF